MSMNCGVNLLVQTNPMSHLGLRSTFLGDYDDGPLLLPPALLAADGLALGIARTSRLGDGTAGHGRVARVAILRLGLGQKPLLGQTPKRRRYEVDAQPGGNLEE